MGFFDRLIPEDDEKTRKAKETEDKLIRQNMQRSKFAEMFAAHKDKQFIASERVEAPIQENAFPELVAQMLTSGNEPVHINVPRDLQPGTVTLVTLAFQAVGQEQLRPWQGALIETFRPLPVLPTHTGAVAASAPVRMLNLLYLPGMFFSFFSSTIVNSTRRALDSDLVPFSAVAFEKSGRTAEGFCNAARVHNRMMGHVMLLDGQGHVRWRAHEKPAEGEIDGMLAATRTLLRFAAAGGPGKRAYA